ncbi:MAG: Histidine-tRNA ligase [archaeon GW2011_AR20]|nr:MAG: Histidine-tRNA ligase [archaeon GW2011_AR20]MBS3160781.1 histidine--tRNA ligase [Candidatus Woesearchaeota archaeon]
MTDMQNPKGTKDINVEEKIQANRIIKIITEVFEKYGFNPLQTTTLEKYETLAAKYAGGSEILKETFKLRDQGKRNLGLRYDLSVPLARYIAMNPNLKIPFKRYEIGQVFRDGPIKTGRYREFTQLDADTVGSSNMLADAELLAMTSEVFSRLNLKFIIRLNNRKILDSILEYYDIPKEKREIMILSIDKLDKIEVSGVKKELTEKGFKKVDNLLNLIFTNDLNDVKKVIKNKEGIDELNQVIKYCKLLNVKNLKVDISLARGLAYYTGTIFEVYLRNSEIKSSVAAGGRYDKMIGSFIGRDVPAVGISFGIDVVKDALKQNKEKSVAEFYLIPINTLEKSLMILTKLRQNNLKCDIDLNDKGISKNLEYASKYEIPYVVLIGNNELKQNKVKLRDMKTGKEKLFTVNELILKFKKF